MTNVYIQHLARTDLLLAEACKRCEAFVGKRADYNDCISCPVLKMALRHAKDREEIADLESEISWMKIPDGW